jgi:hypothetical protein
MRFKSVATTTLDAYRAGLELGTVLREIDPEVVLLFASISYDEDFAELQLGLRDGVGSVTAIIFGGTGDGIYETGLVTDYGACALGIDSGGRLHWTVAHASGLETDSCGAARACARQALAQAVGEPVLALVMADGAHADGSQLVEGLASEFTFPFFGGLTGDDRKFTRSRVIADGENLVDTVAILLVSGKMSFSLAAASGWVPLGDPGLVESSHKNTVLRIAGATAQEFVLDRLGKPLGETDLGIVPLAASTPGDDHFFLRTPSHMNDDGSITTFGGLAEGTSVRVCSATRSDVLAAAATATRQAMTGFTPRAALVISCAGRKWLLEDQGQGEVTQIFDVLGEKIPMVGFPSFGEISPLARPDAGYTRGCFHNVTFVICLFGDSE